MSKRYEQLMTLLTMHERLFFSKFHDNDNCEICQDIQALGRAVWIESREHRINSKVVMKYRLCGLTYSEIADAMGVSKSGVRHAIKRELKGVGV